MSISSFRNKRILITGAASGIGRAAAHAFARQGAQLVLCDIDAARLAPVRAEVLVLGGQCTTHGVDVSSESAMRDLAEQVHLQGGALDVLVNNAGIACLGSFFDSPIDFWRRTLDINLMGVVHGLRHFAPSMHEAGGVRRIINVASLAGVVPAPNMTSYAASKSAVIGLSESFDLELRLKKSKVSVTMVLPGIINTPITRNVGNVARSFSAAQLAKLQAYYEANGVSPTVVADSIVAAARDGRAMVLVGPYAKPLYHLRRLSRALLRRILLQDARKMGYA